MTDHNLHQFAYVRHSELAKYKTGGGLVQGRGEEDGGEEGQSRTQGSMG